MDALTTTLNNNGNIMTIADLPEMTGKRWTPKRKANIVHAVNGGLITICEACARYNITLAEFCSWRSAVDAGGLKNLRVVAIADRRKATV